MESLRAAMVAVILDRWSQYHHGNPITESQYYSKGMYCDRSYDVGVANGVLLKPYQLESYSTRVWSHSDYLCPLPTLDWCSQLIECYHNNIPVAINLDTGAMSDATSFSYDSLWQPLRAVVAQHLKSIHPMQMSFISNLRADRVDTHTDTVSTNHVSNTAPLLTQSLHFNLVGHHNALSMHDFEHIHNMLQ